MSDQHTPGPWELCFDHPNRDCAASIASVRQAGQAHRDDPYRVAITTMFACKHPEQLANARLVAAAPELLEALSLIVKDCAIEYAAGGVYTIGVTGCDISKARAAITKARGESMSGQFNRTFGMSGPEAIERARRNIEAITIETDAARDLYKALKAMLDAFVEDPLDANTDKAVEQAYAALAKARGGYCANCDCLERGVGQCKTAEEGDESPEPPPLPPQDQTGWEETC